MSTALEIPDNASKILRDKLRKMFLELMPDDKLDDILKAEWGRFFDDKTEKTTSWGFEAVWDGSGFNKNQLNNDMHAISPFKFMVRQIMLEMFRAKVKEKTEQELSQIEWASNSGEDSTLIGEIVKECAPALFEQASRMFVEKIATTIRDGVIQNRY